MAQERIEKFIESWQRKVISATRGRQSMLGCLVIRVLGSESPRFPRFIGLLTINAMTAASSVLIPLQCEFYAMEGFSQILRTIKLIQKMVNPQLTIEGILLTMYDARGNLSKDVAEEIRAHFPGQVFESVIPRNVRLAEAPSHGKPIIYYDITSRGASSYLQLAREIIQREKHNG